MPLKRSVLTVLLLAGSAVAQTPPPAAVPTVPSEEYKRQEDFARRLWKELLASIQPDAARVSEAAKSPETLWAFLIDPATTFDDRMSAASKAEAVLSPRYVALLAAARLELERELWKYPWWHAARMPPPTGWSFSPPEGAGTPPSPTILGFDWDNPAGPTAQPATLEDLREMPWPWQVQQALRQFRVRSDQTPGIEMVRDLPCKTELEQRVVLHTLLRFPQTAETYGVYRNILAGPHVGYWTSMNSPLDAWPSLSSATGEAWWGTQALIAALAPEAGCPLLRALDTWSGTMRLSERQDYVRWPVPYTARLALMNRYVADAALEGKGCPYQADRRRLDDSLLRSYRPFRRFDEAPQPVDLRQWVESRRAQMEVAAAAEAPAIAAVRSRMDKVTLCKQ